MKTNTFTRFAILLWSCIALSAVQQTATAQTLAHEYSFWADADGTTNAPDVIGGNNGTLFGDAAISGGLLELDGTAGTYVELQPGIVTNDLAVTVEAWGLFPAISQQGVWANLFDFGTKDVNNQDSYSISFCVNTGGGAIGELNAGISDSDNANVGRQDATCDGSLIATGTPGTYVAVVFNPSAGYAAIYVNGVLTGSTPITDTITPGILDVDNLIGADNWGDPTMYGGVSEFRVWNGALSGLDVAASYTSGESIVSTNAGSITSLALTAPYQVTTGGQVPSKVLATAQNTGSISVDITTIATYSSLNTNIATVNAKTGEIQGVAVGSATIKATYGGLSATWPISVIELNSILTHRYSFHDIPNTTGINVADSIGTLNGTAMGDAIETTVGTNQVFQVSGNVGSYLDLSSNSYVNNGIISGYNSATVDFWGTFTALNSDWEYGYSFGQSYGYGVDFLYFSVEANGTHYVNESTGGGGAGLSMAGTFANETVHCTTIIDPVSGNLAMFTNGVLSGVLNGYSVPLSGIDTNFIYFGRSLWTTPGLDGTGDPYLTADSSFNEIRVYNGALTPQQVAMADRNGPGNTNINPGTLVSVSISLPSTMQLGTEAVPGLIGQYTILTNYNITQNSLTPLLIFTSGNSNVAYQGTDGFLHAVGVGTTTISVNYLGYLGSESVTVVRPPPPVLAHRYSFHDAVGSTTAYDSIGGTNWDGTLPNGGTFTGGSGGSLTISSTANQYVSLPPGVIQTNGAGGNYGSLTIDVWVSAASDPVNSMLYAFGNTDTNGAGEDYIFGSLNRDYTAITAVDPGYTAEQSVTGSVAPLPLNTTIHFTGIYNPPAGYVALYTNGVLVGINYGETDPISVVSDAEAYIGHSVYATDPYATLTLDEFRIYNGVLLADQVSASQILGPSVPLANPYAATLTATSGGSCGPGYIQISWPLTETGFSLYSAPLPGGPGAVWTPVGQTPTLVGANWQACVPATGAPMAYELQWHY
jgi:hypothetical protein